MLRGQLLGVIGALVPLSALALTGNDLQQICTNDSGVGRNTCSAYIIGVVDTVSTVEALKQITLVCFPEGATNKQHIDIAKRYLEQHPEERHYSASFLVLLSWALAYPCKSAP